jgi:CHASE3 domain sensor protein
MAKLSHRSILSLLLITPVLLVIELAIGYGIYKNIQSTNQAEEKNSRLDLYLRTNTKYISYAESAQRGYLLTGETKFRDSINADFGEIAKNEAYYDTLPAEIKSRDLSVIQKLSKRKMAIVALTVGLYDRDQRDSALAIVKTGAGIRMMDSLRAASTTIRNEFAAQVTMHKARQNYLFSLFLGLITALFFFNLFLVWYTYRKFLDHTRDLEGMVASLRDANERMGQYTAASYHELKTPLRNISGFAQLLKRRYSHADDSSEENQFVQYITDGIKQMNKIINDMRGKYLDRPAEGE